MFRKILFALITILILFSGLILLSGFKPEITDSIAQFLYDEDEPRGGETSAAAGGPGLTNVDITNIGGMPRADGIQGADGAQGADAPQGSSNDPQGQWGQNGSDQPFSSPDTDRQEASEGSSGTEAGSYVPPEASGIRVPEQVAGRNGYQPVEEKQEEIGDQEARKLEQRLGTGETGDGLSFDPLYYPFYAMLDEQGQHLYRQIYANAQACNGAFVPVEQVGRNALKQVFEAVYNDHPELFWLETAYSCKYMRNGQCVEIDLEFNRTVGNLEQAKEEFADCAGQIIEGARSLSTDYDKERYVHDALIDRADYRLSAPMNQSAYSALVNGSTVCAGYARAFQYMLQQLGIPCYYCTGYAGEAHAWNIVALEDGYYNVDATWDDSEEGSLDFFNKSDADYADTHIRQDLSVYLPPCNGQKYRMETLPKLRSIEELGISPGEVLTSRYDYYNRCYDALSQGGRGDYRFDTIISDETLMQDILSAYETESYREGYLYEAMDAIGATTGTLSLEIEELQGGLYRVSHHFSLR